MATRVKPTTVPRPGKAAAAPAAITAADATTVPTATPAPVGPTKSARKLKLVRDGFTMPESDFALIAALKRQAMSAGREAKKSELLRAGLHALAALDAQALVTALGRLETVKTGRPKKGH